MTHTNTRCRRFRSAAVTAAAIVVASLGAAPATAADGGSHGDVSPMIVGGTPAPVAYAGVGSIQLDKNGFPDWHSCGSVLIAPRFEITAAHCLSRMPSGPPQRADKSRNTAQDAFLRESTAGTGPQAQTDPHDPKAYTIRNGSTNRFTGGTTRGVRSISLHPSWKWGTPDKDGRIGDIALIELARPVWTVQPAQLDLPDAGRPVREIGWGMTNPDPASWGAPAPAQLRQVDVPIVKRGECDAVGIGRAEICLGNTPDGGGACTGDSGGSAIQRSGRDWVVVGLASRGVTQRCGTPNVYTEVAPYVPWIIRAARAIDPAVQIAQSDQTLLG